MKRSKAFKLCIVVLAGYWFGAIAVANSHDTHDGAVSLAEVAEWIVGNVSFPEDALGYGIVGTERFVISADWSGRVYITSHLSALNPAFERELKSVVAKAPRCVVDGMHPDGIYKTVEVDFAALLPPDRKGSLVNVSVYAPPYFVPKNGNRDVMADSRDVFFERVSKRARFPKKMADGAGSEILSVNYVICEDGHLEVTDVSGGDGVMQEVLVKAMKKVRGWNPAITKRYGGVRVYFSDDLSFDVNEDGRVAIGRIKDPVVCNSADAPDDENMIVFTPEIPACLDSDKYTDVVKMLCDSIYVDRKVTFLGSFIIEKDGAVSDVCVASTDSRIDSTLFSLVCNTKWIPARQGGKSVRSLYRFIGEVDEFEYVTGFVSYSFPDFLSGDRYPPLVYDNSSSKMYRRILKAYPGHAANIYGYGNFVHYYNRDKYVQSLIVKGYSPVERPMVKRRRKPVEKLK